MGEGGFTHGRAGADDDKVAFLEAGGFIIEVAEAGFETAECALVLMEFFDAVVSVDQKVFEGDVLGFGGFVGDLEKVLLGAADEFLNIGGRVIGGGGDVGAGLDEAAAEGGLGDQISVGTLSRIPAGEYSLVSIAFSKLTRQ